MNLNDQLDTYYLQTCLDIANRSTCLRTKIGCLLVKDGKVIATGYNGAPDNVKPCVECDKANSGYEHEQGNVFCRGVHAEMRCVLKSPLEGATLYISKQPCYECTKILIQAKVERVVWASDWGNAKLSEGMRGESSTKFYKGGI